LRDVFSAVAEALSASIAAISVVVGELGRALGGQARCSNCADDLTGLCRRCESDLIDEGEYVCDACRDEGCEDCYVCFGCRDRGCEACEQHLRPIEDDDEDEGVCH